MPDGVLEQRRRVDEQAADVDHPCLEDKMLRSLEDVHSSRKEFLRVSQLQQFNTLREQQFTLTSLDEDTD